MCKLFVYGRNTWYNYYTKNSEATTKNKFDEHNSLTSRLKMLLKLINPFSGLVYLSTKQETSVCPYLPITGRYKNRIRTLPKSISAQGGGETSRIWTRLVKSIPDDDDYYATRVSVSTPLCYQQFKLLTNKKYSSKIFYFANTTGS